MTEPTLLRYRFAGVTGTAQALEVGRLESQVRARLHALDMVGAAGHRGDVAMIAIGIADAERVTDKSLFRRPCPLSVIATLATCASGVVPLAGMLWAVS